MKETSVTYIVKELRVLKAAVKERISNPDQYLDLRRRNILKAYSSLDSNNEREGIDLW